MKKGPGMNKKALCPDTSLWTSEHQSEAKSLTTDRDDDGGSTEKPPVPLASATMGLRRQWHGLLNCHWKWLWIETFISQFCIKNECAKPPSNRVEHHLSEGDVGRNMNFSILFEAAQEVIQRVNQHYILMEREARAREKRIEELNICCTVRRRSFYQVIEKKRISKNT